jgi:uridine kinase
MVPALTPALTKITSRLIGSFARQKHKPPNSFVSGSRSSKSDHSDPHQTQKRRLNLEENSPTHLLHGIMTKHDGMFERRESSGSGSSLVALDKRPFMIGVAGGTASGKSTVCEKIRHLVVNEDAENGRQIITLSQDSFYRDLTAKESDQAKKGMFNFDHPDAFDHQLMVKCLKDIKECRSTQVPLYDFKTNSRVEGEFTVIHPSDVVLLEGILVFYYKEVRDLFDMKLFVDTDADTRLARRVLRDIEERGRDLENVLFQYTNLVKPAFEEFCMPTKKHADVIIPRGADNTVAVELVAQHIQDIIYKRKIASKNGSPFTRSRSNSCGEISR